MTRVIVICVALGIAYFALAAPVSAQTIWLHHDSSWKWEWGVYFKAESKARVTDAKSGGNSVAVDRIEVYIKLDGKTSSQVQTSASSAHHVVRIRGLIIRRPTGWAWACIEHRGYDRLCSDRKRI